MRWSRASALRRHAPTPIVVLKGGALAVGRLSLQSPASLLGRCILRLTSSRLWMAHGGRLNIVVLVLRSLHVGECVWRVAHILHCGASVLIGLVVASRRPGSSSVWRIVVVEPLPS